MAHFMGRAAGEHRGELNAAIGKSYYANKGELRIKLDSARISMRIITNEKIKTNKSHENFSVVQVQPATHGKLHSSRENWLKK